MGVPMKFLTEELDAMKQNGLYGTIRTLESPQGAWVTIGGKKYLNLCSNNYLGLANHPEVIEAGIKGLRDYGAGTASVRERFPDVFETFVQRYSAVLRQYFDRLVLDAKRPRDEMERIVTELGDYGAGPRDLVDVHMVALNRSVESQTGLKAQTLSVEGRLLALEMMGLLVDYYRVGRRRMRGTETS